MLRLAVGTLVVVSAVAVFAAASPNLSDCTKVGTPQGNVMSGTNGKDVLCALEGRDFLSGDGGKDRLYGDAGRDTLVGGKAPDTIKGGKGKDRLFAVDGNPHDVLAGGKGQDACFGDPGDKMTGCEDTFRGPSIVMTNDLSAAFNGGLALGEELAVTPPTPTIVTVTTTETVPENCGGHPAPPPIC